MTAEDDRRITYIPLEKATAPTTGALAYVDYWWSVHPEKGIIIWMKYSIQANPNESISRRLTKRMYPWAECRQIPVVYIPRQHQDHSY